MKWFVTEARVDDLTHNAKYNCAICYIKYDREIASHGEYARGLHGNYAAHPEIPKIIWICRDCMSIKYFFERLMPFNWWFVWKYKRPKNIRKRAAYILRNGALE